MNPSSIKTGLIQPKLSGTPAENRQMLASKIESCAAAGARLIVLPELHDTRYFCQSEEVSNFNLAEPIPGPSTTFYSALASRHGVVLVVSLFEKRAPGLYHNTAIILESDGSMAGKYRKMHIPDDPAYYEKFYFAPGDLGFSPVPTSVGKLGVMICWDQWFPEAARLMALAGAEILIYPTAIGWESSDSEEEKLRQTDAWMTIQRSHAIANGLPLVSINRTGYEPDRTGSTGGITFWGNSFMCGPQGEMIARASAENEEFIVHDIDLRRGEQVRKWWPFLRDRRIDAYNNITMRYIGD